MFRLHRRNICRAAKHLGTTAFLLMLSLPVFAEVHLLPQPREVSLQNSTSITSGIRISVPGHDAEDEFAAKDLQEFAHEAGIPVESGSTDAYSITLLRNNEAQAKELLKSAGIAFTSEQSAEGYVLILQKRGGYVIGESSAGVFYGVQTMKQLLSSSGAKAALPLGTIRDWPAMRYRGIDDDLSRGPVPTLAFQKHQIRVLASFKINIYSPYFEHTLAYTSQPLTAPRGGALTPQDVAELVSYARQYHVTIVPEQEAFGHLHHVLKYDLYQDVAETPYGHVLSPLQKGSLPLIKSWFTEIASEFPSPFLHIGADETDDLGIGRTRELVEKQGLGETYAQFLTQIHEQLAPLHRRLLYWGDIAMKNPTAVAALPKDMIAVPWVYSPESSYEKFIRPFTNAGIETWVAPGVSNWSLVYPDNNVAFVNIQGFLRDGQKLGSTGALTTVWNDDGEGLFQMDWYGVLFGATASWQPGESSIADYQTSYGPVFHGDFTGKINQAQKELMAANQVLAKAHTGMSSDFIFWADPWSPNGRALAIKMQPFNRELRLHAEQAIILIAEARAANPNLREQVAIDAMDLGARRLDLIGMKFEFSQEIQNNYTMALKQQHDKSRTNDTVRLLRAISDTNGLCQDLRDAYSATKSEYREVWLSENRPYWLDNVLVRYDLEIQRWQQRGTQLWDITDQLMAGKDLPSPESIGIPVSGSPLQ